MQTAWDRVPKGGTAVGKAVKGVRGIGIRDGSIAFAGGIGQEPHRVRHPRP